MFEYAERLARWADALRSDSDWTSALESAFDAIGFDEPYISTLPEVRRRYNRIKAIKDHVWGMIEIEPEDAWLLDSPLFQRMRCVRQTGLTYLTYPNANHTRFEHSLGVYFVVKRLLATFRRTKEAFKIAARQRRYHEVQFTPAEYERHSRQERLILHASLLHDIGHSVFSHVSERLFAANPSRLRIGTKTVLQFRREFQEKYELVDSDIQTGQGKPLAELLTVAIITSSRFARYYRMLPGRSDDDPLPDLYDISALVLGDRIEPNDFALPELLSGPVDADKIDYMVRDAQACGISIGIDVARVFVRAGTYECSSDAIKPLELRGYNSRLPIRLFVIEQSGTDAIREIGIARLSLYERVYYHQLTRGAQAAFGDMILCAAESRNVGFNIYGDYLALWKMPEDVVLTELSRCGDEKISSIARSISTRRLPKRAACFGREFLYAPEAAVDVVNNALQDAHEQRLQDFSNEVLSRLDGATGEELIVSIRRECSQIRDLLDRYPPAGMSLPPTRSPAVCRLLPYPRQHDSAPPPALVMRGDRVERFGDRYFSYLYAGETPSQIGYLLVSDEWREIALLAFQNVLCRTYLEDYTIAVDGELADDETSTPTTKFELDALFRPWLNAESAGRRCKIHAGDFDAITSSLVSTMYFDALPQLIPQKMTADIELVADRFSEFAGEQGWRIGAHHIASFISQFPPRLRPEVMELLRDDRRLLFLNREQTIKLVIEGLARLTLEKPMRLVPFTPSSGQYIRTHIRSIVDSESFTVHAGLEHALNVVHSSGGSIVFVDDNIASGTQASRQLEIYMGAAAESPEGNYIIAPLSDDEKVILRSGKVGAVFSIGHEAGRAKLQETAKRHAIPLSVDDILWGKPIDQVSGRGVVSDDLRTFLGEVGETVLRRRFEREGRADAAAAAHSAALGYGGLEGLVVTSFSVPTSTYPAFWCPGFREPVPLGGDQPIRIPWVPLFLRTNMLKILVLG